jgi:hypothetical protein
MFLAFDFDPLSFYVEAQAIEDGHVLICYPYQREQSQQVSSPVCVDELESGDQKEEERNPMAETIFTRK